jgi:hypothetical protein
MGDGWRVNVTLRDLSRRSRRLCRRTVVPELRGYAGDDIQVTSGKAHIFVYAGTVDAAERAGRIARQVLAQHDVSSDFRQERWDPIGGSWHEAAPGTPHDEAAEMLAAHEYDQERDRQWSLATGRAAWQVRIELPSRHDRTALARHLRSEGWPVAKRRKYLVAGANCEDDANGLAQEVRGYCSPCTVIRVERGVYGGPGFMWIGGSPGQG